MDRLKPRVLITGGSGFVGRQIVDALAPLDLALHTAGRGPFSRTGIVHHRLDLLDDNAADSLVSAIRPTHVLHAAWFADHGDFWNSAQNRRWLRATIALASAAKSAGVARFVGVGSVAEYSLTAGIAGTLSEAAPLRPQTAYGEAKAWAFRALSILFDEGPTRFAWARLFHLFGEGESPGKLTAYAARELAAGRWPELRQPDAVFDFLDVNYVGAALAALLLAPAEGPVNVARGEGTSVRDLAVLIGSACGWAIPVVPPSACAAAGLRLVADVSRLRRMIGLPAPRPLAETLTYLCRSATPPHRD